MKSKIKKKIKRQKKKRKKKQGNTGKEKRRGAFWSLPMGGRLLGIHVHNVSSVQYHDKSEAAMTAGL